MRKFIDGMKCIVFPLNENEEFRRILNESFMRVGERMGFSVNGDDNQCLILSNRYDIIPELSAHRVITSVIKTMSNNALSTTKIILRWRSSIGRPVLSVEIITDSKKCNSYNAYVCSMVSSISLLADSTIECGLSYDKVPGSSYAQQDEYTDDNSIECLGQIHGYDIQFTKAKTE